MSPFPRSPGRAVALLLGAGLATTLGAGVTLAATSGSNGYHACADAKGDLQLRTAKGHCPSGSSSVTVGARGPAGPRGRIGAAGQRGPAGPGAASSVADTSTSSASTGDTVTLAGTDLTVSALCTSAHSAGVGIVGADDYDVHGIAAVTASGSGGLTYSWYDGTGQHVMPLAEGGANVAYEAVGGGPSFGGQQGDSSDLSVNVPDSNGSADADAQLLLHDGTQLFGLQVHLGDTGSRCQAQVQVVPTGG
jgi:hypothetical protein